MAGGTPSFDETYPRYEFSELVRLVVVAAAWIGARHRARGKEPPAAVAGNVPAAPA